MRINISTIILLTFLLISCSPKSNGPSSCMENPDSDRKLLVIIGEKINIKEIEPYIDTNLLMGDSRFIAHYKILQKICGDYDKDTITFTAHDHYGFPAFGNYKHTLLYLSVFEKGIYHVKYLYSDLYRTKDGRWASPYSALDYGFDERVNTTIKPEIIDFAQEVSFSIEGFTRKRTQTWFPEPYYKIDKERKKAIAIWGNYIPDLFQLQKETGLRGWGFYGKPDSMIPKPVELVETEWLKLSKKDSLELLKTWHSLVKAIKTNDTLFIKKKIFR